MKKILSLIIILTFLFIGTHSFGYPLIIHPVIYGQGFYHYLRDLIDVVTTTPNDDDVLTYNASSKLWGPEEATTGTTTTVEEGDVPVGDPDILTLDFLAADFILSEAPDTEVNIAIDYANGQVATTDVHGFLSDTDWDTFNGKAPANAHYLTDQAEGGLSAEVVVTANGKALVVAADYAAMRTLLDLESGVDFNAYDADLTTYAGITPSANVQSLLGAANYGAFADLLEASVDHGSIAGLGDDDHT